MEPWKKGVDWHGLHWNYTFACVCLGQLRWIYMTKIIDKNVKILKNAREFNKHWTPVDDVQVNQGPLLLFIIHSKVLSVEGSMKKK